MKVWSRKKNAKLLVANATVISKTQKVKLVSQVRLVSPVEMVIRGQMDD